MEAGTPLASEKEELEAVAETERLLVSLLADFHRGLDPGVGASQLALERQLRGVRADLARLEDVRRANQAREAAAAPALALWRLCRLVRAASPWAAFRILPEKIWSTNPQAPAFAIELLAGQLRIGARVLCPERGLCDMGVVVHMEMSNPGYYGRSVSERRALDHCDRRTFVRFSASGVLSLRLWIGAERRLYYGRDYDARDLLLAL